MKYKWTRYYINGKSVASQLTNTQYNFFLSRLHEGNSVEKSFNLALKHAGRKIKHTVSDKQYWENPTYEVKLKKEISFFKSRISFYQKKLKKLVGKEKVFFLPIPLNAKMELESVMLATRLGTLIMEIKEIERQRRNRAV